MKRLHKPALASAIGLCCALLLAEGLIRVKHPSNVDGAGVELQLFRGDQSRVAKLYTLDPTLGFRPVLPSELFGPLGARRNDYADVPPEGVRRILFIGDSVTFRGKLIEAVRAVYGDDGFEYWNGGVTAFNTAQEVEYFRRYTLGTRPHEVILTFHQNDFMSTPISFREADGRMVVIAPSKHHSEVVPWLFRWSHLYRYYVGASRAPDPAEAENEIRSKLIELRDLCAQHGIPLTVLVLPHLAPLEEWRPVQHHRREWALATLAELGIRHFDLFESMQQALAEGAAIQETPGDKDHPNDKVCAYFARDLAQQGLLSAP